MSESYQPQQKVALTAYIKWHQQARDKQKTPSGDWNIWLILAGRGWGKTRTGAQDIAAYAMENPDVICGVVAPTKGDLRRVCFEGHSGLLGVIPPECMLSGDYRSYNKSSMEIKLWNGSIIQGYAAIEPDRLRGPQFHRVWADEMAAWRYTDAYDQLMFGLRLGSDPRLVVTTTPRPTPLIMSLAERAGKDVHITKGNTFENEANLADSALDQLRERYEGTRLGRQELYADILDDVEGALWSHTLIENSRVNKEQVPEMQRVIVAIDPAVTANANSDETGIVVAGRSQDGQFYVFEDASLKASPEEWTRKAIQLYHDNKADKIVAEVNNGGDLVERLIRITDRNVSYRAVNASRGKIVRAEPVAALYEQGRVHHVGTMPELEDQMCSYTGLGGKSPDRLDALVWAITELSSSTGQPMWRIS